MVDTISFASSRNSLKFLPAFGTIHHVLLQHLDFYLDHTMLFLAYVWGGGIHENFISAYCALYIYVHCRNPNLAKCGGEAQHLEKLGIWSPPGLPNVQSSTAGPKTPRIGVFLVSLERS